MKNLHNDPNNYASGFNKDVFYTSIQTSRSRVVRCLTVEAIMRVTVMRDGIKSKKFTRSNKNKKTYITVVRKKFKFRFAYKKR